MATSEIGYRGRSLPESEVVHAVWKEVGGELVEEFVVPTLPDERSRARELDGVIVTGRDGHWHRARTPLALENRDVTVCQAKAGVLDFGVLGQTLFGAELLERQHRPGSLRLIAAAVQPNALIDQLLADYRPNGRLIEHRTYPHLPVGRSSGAEASAELRQLLVTAAHRDLGGLLITAGVRHSRRDFGGVRVSGQPLRVLEANAIVLPARDTAVVDAMATVTIEPAEPVRLVYTCSDLYMTAMGRAVFGSELARRQLGLTDVQSLLRYRVDNAVLRELLAPYPQVVAGRARPRSLS